MKKIVQFHLAFFSLFTLYGCGENDNPTANTTEPIQWYKPSIESTFQWQLLDTINLSYHVDIYDIDLFDTNSTTIEKLHNDNKKVICYFSAGSYENWREDKDKFPESVLGNDLDGWEGEKWLDISNIDALKSVMQSRLDLAKSKGCDGVEPDNMDGYLTDNNAGFDLTSQDQFNYNKWIAEESHKRGLSVGLKNDLEQIIELEPYYDFAVNEQCNYYNECSYLKPFIDANKPVFNIEYDSKYIVDNDANQTLCDITNSMQFQTLVLPINLDDSFRYSCNSKDKFFNNFGVGFGSSSSFKFKGTNDDFVYVDAVDLILDENIAQNNYYKSIKDFNGTAFSNLQGYLANAKYFTMWVTKGWEESWYNIDKINEAIKSGKIPIFVYWYFGDELVNGMPSVSEVDEYYKDNIKLKTFLDKINGQKVVIFEPEFNKQSVLANPDDFTSFISHAIDTINFDDKNNTILTSLCMTDTGDRSENETYTKCGYENCALGDKYEWSLSKPIFDKLLDKIDFISFQEMLGQFSRDPSNPGGWNDPNPISYTNQELGIDYLPQRLENMASYLYELYKKPIFLPYITIATSTWNDENADNIIDTNELNKSGYELQVSKFYSDINKTKLQQNHLFGFSVMELFDKPDHDLGGYQYFMNNEYHLGIIKSSAQDENDSAINGDIELKSDIIEKIFN